MLIRCPTCASGYDVPRDFMVDGRVLRCAHCRDAWAYRESAAPAGPEAERQPIEIAAEARSGRGGRETTMPRPVRRRRRIRALPRLGAGAVAVSLVLGSVASGMAAVAVRQSVVAAFPPSAAVFAALGVPVNLRGLALDDLRSSVEQAGGGGTLAIDGRITNVRRESTAVPSLRIAVRDAADRELYFWTAPAPKSRLAAGETVRFHSRLSTPPRDGQTLAVSFVEPNGARMSHVAEATSAGR